MTREDLIKELKEKETLKERVEATYQQLIGQIAMLRDLIKREDEVKKEEPKGE